MKIALGINIFGSFHRQDMCIESLKRLKKEFPDIIDLYNIQPLSDIQKEPEFKTLPALIRTAKDLVPDGTQDKPLIKDMFGVLSELEDYDYFIFTNSDIILSNRFIKLIQDNPKKDSFCGARLAIQDIKNLDETPELVQYQVAGFDTFAVKSEWWYRKENKFPDYVYAEPCWDVHYATLCKKHGKSMFVNKWPAALFHINHEIAWSDMTPERKYNEEVYFKTHKNDCNMWHSFLFNVLLKRTPDKGYYNPFSNEEEIEDTIFRA
tara:strand:+ start:8616 stop:9407 length:792 start_codon:yes stop_codon:yes gene_type:complete